MSRAPRAGLRLTPAGVGGVAVVSVRGPGAKARLARLLGRPLPAAGTIAYGLLTPPQEGAHAPPIDEVLVIGRASGAVEVHAHGSPAVVEELIGALGPGSAAGGERPSLEERASIAAWSAPTGLGARVLLDQARGSLRSALDSALIAAPESRARTLATLAARGERLLRLLTPATVVLTGPVNAGKSTLFNVLAGDEVAAVTDVAGTTRDALGVPARLGPWPVILVDTAGERALDPGRAGGDPGASVEREGQGLARSAAAGADLVLALSPAGSARVGGSRRAGGHAAPVCALHTQAARTMGLDPRSWGPGTISALEAPGHARDLVAAAFAAHLDPGPAADPLWSPGRAVPFETDLIDALAHIARSGEAQGSALASRLDAL